MTPPKDIAPLGAGDGRRYYWIKEQGSLDVGHLRLVAIDDLGEVTRTPIGAEWDENAMTKAEAIQAHLSGSVQEADRELERRKRDAPPPKPKPPPMSPATRRFLDDSNAIDLNVPGRWW